MLEERSTFERLAEELSTEERRSLLRKIEASISISQEPLTEVKKTAEHYPADTQVAYQSLNGLIKFLFQLKAFFTGKTPVEVYEESLLAKLKKNLLQHSPGICDFKRSLFLEPFKIELDNLKASASFFKPLLQAIVEKKRPEFIAFLVRCHCEELIKRLELETDPRQIVSAQIVKNEIDLRTEMENRFTKIIGELDETTRRAIYLDYQALDYLKRLSEFDFENILNQFTPELKRGQLVCHFATIGKRLIKLASILKSLHFPPSVLALKALFLFNLKKTPEALPDFEKYLRELYLKAEESNNQIRNFNKKIALEEIAKIITADYNLTIHPLKGGEDWFALFKKYWQGRLGERYRNYTRELRTTSLVEKALALCGIKNFKELPFYHSRIWGDLYTPLHWRSLAFCFISFQNIFIPRFSKSLKILYQNGQFYKPENRVEFSNAFNYLISLSDKINYFGKMLSTDGGIGKEIEEIKKENISLDLRFKKIEPLFKKVDSEARVIVEKTISALKSVNKILGGILYGQAGGKYDSLANLSYLGGKDNNALRKEWEKLIALSYEMFQLLTELLETETPH